MNKDKVRYEHLPTQFRCAECGATVTLRQQLFWDGRVRQAKHICSADEGHGIGELVVRPPQAP